MRPGRFQQRSTYASSSALRIAVSLAALVLLTAGCGARWSRSEDARIVSAPGEPQQPGQNGVFGTPTAGPTTSLSPGAVPTDGATGGPIGGPTTGPTSGPVDPGPRPGVTNTTIKVCYLVPLTGAAPVPTNWRDGANAYWEYLKTKGGINGRNVQLTIIDTESDVATARAGARDCINSKMFTVVTLDRFEVESAVGTYLNSQGMPNLLVQAPPSATGSDQRNTFVTTIDHRLQGKLIADYFTAGDLKGKRYAVVREDVKDLIPGTQAFKNELAARGGTFAGEERVDGNANDFSATVLKLKNDYRADVVWFYGAPTPMIKLAQQSQAAAYHPVWFANSISWAFDTAAQVGNANGALSGARAFSSWVAVTSAAASQYKTEYRRQHPNDTPDDIGLVGWGVGETLGAALKAAGPSLGWNTFRSAFQSLQFSATTWAPLAFGTGDRYGATKVVEFRISGDHWNQAGTFRGSF